MASIITIGGIPVRIIDGSIPYTPDQTRITPDGVSEPLNDSIITITDTGINDPRYPITNLLSRYLYRSKR